MPARSARTSKFCNESNSRSASPRRRDLIAAIDGLEAEIVPSRADESVENSSDPRSAPKTSRL
ncbi:MAG: hypothetical protein ACLUSP_05090 [Christensenellales bacterium]